MPRPVRLASAAEWRHVATWLENAGVSASNGALVGDLVHLQMGVGYPLDPNVNVFVSASSGLHLGFTFR